MRKFEFTFDRKKELGENFYINNYDNSAICTCGYHKKPDSNQNKECPSCKTKAILSLRDARPGLNEYSICYLEYLHFDNDGFEIKTKEIKIYVNLITVVQNNIAVYEIDKDSLKTEIKDRIDLKFYYTINKKGNYAITSEYFYKGSKYPFNTSNCPSLYGTSLITNEVFNNLRKICLERYSNDIWKIYSYYKNAPELIRNGYINFKANVSEIRMINSLLKNEEFKDDFEKLIQQYEYISEGNTIYYNDFANVYALRHYYYDPHQYDINFIRYIMSIDNESLKHITINERYTYATIKTLYYLDFNSEEANNFIALAIRQKASLRELFDEKLIDIINVYKKHNIKIEKNPKDIRIFIDKLTLLKHFYTYVYNDKMQYIEDTLLKMKILRYENKIKEIAEFIVSNRDDFFSAATELAIEQKTKDVEFGLLYKDEQKIKDCLLIIDNKKIIKILYKNEVYDTTQLINDFLLEIQEESLSCVV